MNFIGFIDTWKEVLLRPSDFYKKMPTTGGYDDPLVFALVNLAIYSLLLIVFSPDRDVLYYIVFILSGFITFFISAFAEITLLDFAFKRLGGTGTYEGTARLVLYSKATTIFILIPLVGVITYIYMFYLYVVGGKFVHNLDTRNSMIAASILIVVSLVVGILYIRFFKT